MPTVKRSVMRPGQMFRFWDAEAPSVSDILVVLDEQYEVGFWRGHRYQVGAIAPHSHFEVIA